MPAMLNEELIDVVNSGQAWGLVGSGASCMAGVPSWGQLLLSVKDRCVATAAAKPFDEPHFRSVGTRDIPKAFLYLEEVFGRPAIDATVASIVAGFKDPGEMHAAIAEWQLAGYATLNYDSLLETALSSADRASWTPVGNAASENRLICREANHLVWHPHGVAAYPHKNLRLVLTSNDYDELYASGSSTLAALDSLLRMKRIIIFGFGFTDDDILRVLTHIRRVTTPGKPAFALLPNCSAKKQFKYRSEYNVEVVPYRAEHNDHSHALAVLKVYSSFIIPREVQYAVPTSIHPEFDEQVTSLLTHNRLVSHGVQVSKDAGQALLTACVVRQFAAVEQLTDSELRARLPSCSIATLAVLPQVIKALVDARVVSQSADKYRLLPAGVQLLKDASSHSELLHEQFFQCVYQRCKQSVAADADIVVDRVATLGAEYFRTLGKNCGLAVAQQLTRVDVQQSRARRAAILQSLHKYVRQCQNNKEAACLVQLVLQILDEPSKQEEVYLGYLSQAYFGQHILNADFNSSHLAAEHLKRTVFVLDASFLIWLMAPSARGHSVAFRIFQRLKELKCPLATTALLLEEIAEHARYAWQVLHNYGPLSPRVVEVARRGKAHSNVFLESYLVDPTYGPNTHYQRYFDDKTNANGARPHRVTLKPYVESLGIQVKEFDKWEGATPKHNDRVNCQRGEIEQRRSARGTYRHERQVLAEAEVVLAVSELRNGDFQLNGEVVQDAFFVSQSRILDNLPGMPPWICMTPTSLLNWQMAVREINREDASALFDQILFELSHSGIAVLPRGQLVKVFSGVISASKDRVAELKRERRDLIRERYGADPDLAFKDFDPLAWPIIESQYDRNIFAEYEAKIAREQSARTRLEDELKKSKRDDKDYARLKAREKARRQESRRRGRREASKPKKKHKRKK
jgi:hypothetical protein